MALLGQLFWIMCALLFFAADGHLITLNVMVESFTLFPIGRSIYEFNIQSIIMLFAWMFSSALLLSMPGIIAMLLVNLTFGVASRAAPSLNIFVLGFPMSLLMGFFCGLFCFFLGAIFRHNLSHSLRKRRQNIVS